MLIWWGSANIVLTTDVALIDNVVATYWTKNTDVILTDNVTWTDDVFQPIRACHITQSWAFKLFSFDGYDLPIVSINRGLSPLIWQLRI